MFKTWWNKLKEVISRMLGNKTVAQALNVTPAISNKMINAIDLWSEMYKGHSPWVREPSWDDPTRIVSLGLPSFIASEKARMATLEMKSEITSPNLLSKVNDRSVQDVLDDNITKFESEEVETSPRVKFLNDTYQRKVVNRLRPNLEYGIATGGMVIKPYVELLNQEVNDVKAKINVDFISADNFIPLAFSVNGDITKAAFVQTKVDSDGVYRRLEIHTLLDGCKCVVENHAYLNRNLPLGDLSYETDLGQEIPLTSVPEWKDLDAETVIENVDKLLFAYFKMPEANTVDPYSPLGMSGYGRAIDLIKDADMQYSRLLWEFEATEAAIDVDRDALKPYTDLNGVNHSIRPDLQNRLFRTLDLGKDDTYQPYLPTIRDVSIINGLNTILTRIEDVCALSRGTISTTNVEATTATELKILKQRSFSVNSDIQKALENTLRDVIKIMDIYCTLYNIVPEADYEVSFEWDDSILVDTAEEMSKRVTLIANGIYSKTEFRMWYFGETEEQAKQALKIIEDENKKAIMHNAQIQQQAGETISALNNNTHNQQIVNGRDDIDENGESKDRGKAEETENGEKKANKVQDRNNNFVK